MSDPVTACLDCGAPLGSRYCAACGQDHRRARLDTKGVLRDAFDAVTDLDSTFWTTFRGLLRDPGRLARDYVDGRRRRHMPPLRYMLISLAFYAALLVLTDSRPTDLGASVYQPELTSPRQTEFMTQYLAWVNRHFNFLIATIIPVMAVVLRWLFRSTGLNVAECLVLASYSQAQTFFLLAPFPVLLRDAWPPVVWAVMILSTAYQAWAIAGFFRTAWWRGLLAYVAAYVTWLVIFVSAVIVIVIVLTVTGALRGAGA